jgi:C4-dicarboxylate-specific signal transduction histidine kinase
MTQPKGRQVVPFLEALHRDQSASRTHMLNEVASLEQYIGHIKEIVSIQQSYATMRGLVEDIDVEATVEDAIKMSQGAFLRHGPTLRREFKPMPKITGERGKILQILHNLLRNAKNALDESSTTEKAIEIRIEAGSDGMVRIVVQDNGVGILPENLTRIFAQGFTTRKDGHGFGLHSAANAAQEMRGSLNAHSEGLGTGASFILELPLAQAQSGARIDHKSDSSEGP